MGAFGSRVDPGSSSVLGALGIGNRPIYELRSIGHVAPDDLPDQGLAAWDMIDIAHGRRPGLLGQIASWWQEG